MTPPTPNRGLRRLGDVLVMIHRESFRHALYLSGKSAVIAEA